MKTHRFPNLPALLAMALLLPLPRMVAEWNDPLLSRLPVPIELTPPDMPPTDLPPAMPTPEPTPPPPPLQEREKGELSLGRQQILAAREQLRDAVRTNPGDPELREQYAWFLYSNGFHDRECLSLLEQSLRGGSAGNPTGLFNAIVEVRAELKLPATPLRAPTPPPHQVATRVSRHAVRAQDKETAPTVTEQSSFRRWIFTPYYDYSSFNHGRQPWQEEFAQLLCRINPALTLGGEVDVMERPPSGTNIYYSALASWYVLKTLEIHGKISICPAPTFAATQIYSGGAAWQALPRLGVLLDYQHYNFIWGPIDQINPGLVWSFTDTSWLTMRYVRGWAFYNLEYNYYSAALNLALPGKRRLTCAFAYGTDPDAEIGAGGTTVSSLTPAYTYSVFLTQPLTRDLTLFAGIQYLYRLTKYGGGELYEQITPTLGCSWQF
jgi:hypothetical protein